MGCLRKMIGPGAGAGADGLAARAGAACVRVHCAYACT